MTELAGLEKVIAMAATMAVAEICKVGPKGFIHGWIYVGPKGEIGHKFNHPEHGPGEVTGHFANHVEVFHPHSNKTMTYAATYAKQKPKMVATGTGQGKTHIANVKVNKYGHVTNKDNGKKIGNVHQSLTGSWSYGHSGSGHSSHGYSSKYKATKALVEQHNQWAENNPVEGTSVPTHELADWEKDLLDTAGSESSFAGLKIGDPVKVDGLEGNSTYISGPHPDPYGEGYVVVSHPDVGAEYNAPISEITVPGKTKPIPSPSPSPSPSPLSTSKPPPKPSSGPPNKKLDGYEVTWNSTNGKVNDLDGNTIGFVIDDQTSGGYSVAGPDMVLLNDIASTPSEGVDMVLEHHNAKFDDGKKLISISDITIEHDGNKVKYKIESTGKPIGWSTSSGSGYLTYDANGDYVDKFPTPGIAATRLVNDHNDKISGAQKVPETNDKPTFTPITKHDVKVKDGIVYSKDGTKTYGALGKKSDGTGYAVYDVDGKKVTSKTYMHQGPALNALIAHVNHTGKSSETIGTGEPSTPKVPGVFAFGDKVTGPKGPATIVDVVGVDAKIKYDEPVSGYQFHWVSIDDLVHAGSVSSSSGAPGSPVKGDWNTALTGTSAYAVVKSPQALSSNESQAISTYGLSHGYRIVNPYLFHNEHVFDTNTMTYRPATESEKELAKKTIAGLDGAFAKTPATDKNIIVHRGTGSAGVILGPVGSKVGKTFTNKGYTSTTTKVDAKTGHGYGYETKNAKFEILVPAGSKMLKVNSHEHEALLPRNATFKVIDDRIDANGIRRVKMEYVPDKAAAGIAPPVEEKKPLTGLSAYDHVERGSLPHGTKTSIGHYSDDGFVKINTYLRTNALPSGYGGGTELPTPEKEKEIAKHVAAIDKAFDVVKPTTEPIIVYRGTGHAEQLFGDIGANIGRVFRDNGYVSTSTDMSVASGFGGSDQAFIKIIMPPGSHLLKLGEASYHSHESELLVRRGAKFKIISDLKVGYKREITAEMIL